MKQMIINLAWDDSDEDNVMIEMKCSPRVTEIIRDCLEAGLEAYEDDEDADPIRTFIDNL